MIFVFKAFMVECSAMHVLAIKDGIACVQGFTMVDQYRSRF